MGCGTVRSWYGHDASGFQAYAPTLDAARRGQVTAAAALGKLIRDTETPAIVRATALTELRPWLDQQTVAILPSALADADPAVRTAAVGILDQTPLRVRTSLALPMLKDPVRMVRMEAARVLAPVPRRELSPDQRKVLYTATEEYIDAQMAYAERPDAWTALGDLNATTGTGNKAREAYEAAMKIDPDFLPALINLADLYQAQGNEQEAEKILRRVMVSNPTDARLHYALGLSLIRQQLPTSALAELSLAASLDVENARYAYVYAVALKSSAKTEEAIEILSGAHDLHPQDVDILSALVSFHQSLGHREVARAYMKKLRSISR